MNNQSFPTDHPQNPAPSWTPEKQREFLEALARCGSVKSSAAYVGMSREGAYRLRRRQEGRAFDRAWDAANASRLGWHNEPRDRKRTLTGPGMRR